MLEAAESTRRRRYIRRYIPYNQVMKTRFQPVLTAKQTGIDAQQTVIDAQQMAIVELKQQLEAMTMARKK